MAPHDRIRVKRGWLIHLFCFILAGYEITSRWHFMLVNWCNLIIRGWCCNFCSMHAILCSPCDEIYICCTGCVLVQLHNGTGLYCSAMPGQNFSTSLCCDLHPCARCTTCDDRSVQYIHHPHSITFWWILGKSETISGAIILPTRADIIPGMSQG